MIVYLEKDKKAALAERGIRKMKQSCRHQGERRKRERKCSRHLSRDFLITPEVVEEKVLPGSSQRELLKEIPHCSQWRDHVGAGGYALKEAAGHGDPMQEKTSDRNCIQWSRAHTHIFWHNLWYVGDQHCSHSWRTVLHGKDSIFN